MRLETWSTEHRWWAAFAALAVMLGVWLVLMSGRTQRNARIPGLRVADSAPILVARIGHLLPVKDRHIPFSIEKRNGRYTFIVKK